MGVERGVTLWYVQRQFIQNEISTLEAQLEQILALAAPLEDGRAPVISDKERTIQQALSKARAKLHAQGPCPRPMMG